MADSNPNQITRRKYERISWLYDFLDLPFEYSRYRRGRAVIFQGITGRLLDAGVGTGRNIPYYPQRAQITGIDLSPAMLIQAERRRRRHAVSMELLEMDVLDTSFPDGHFDSIVATFLFCTLKDSQQLPALRELRRICKQGGSIRILEYAYSQVPWKRLIMHLWEPWVRWAYGAGFDRNTEQYVGEAGLRIADRAFLYQDIVKLLVLQPVTP